MQLRIEAQGKYLQSVLKKAQDTLSGYNSSVEVEIAKAELSQLVSMVNNSCPASSLSALTDIKDSCFIDNKQLRGTRCSLESCLTSSESSGRREDGLPKPETNKPNMWNSNSVELSLMDMHPGKISGSMDNVNARKRSGSTISDDNCVDQPYGKRSTAHKSHDQLRNFDLLQNFDLNSHYLNDSSSGPKAIDLNRKEVDQSNDYI